jgi:hypothetical protein
MVLHRLLVLAFVLVFAACGNGPTQPDPPPPPPPPPSNTMLTSVTVTSPNNAVTVGQTEQFTATANFSNGTTQAVTSTATWTSSNNGVATVAATGLASGVSAGTADIRAAFQGMTGSKTLQVNAPARVAPVARFVVTGPGGQDTCRIIVGSGGDLDCRFDGSASSGGTGGNVTRWRWRFDVGANSSSPRDTSDPVLNVRTDCGFFADRPAAQPGTSFVQMIVKLEVRNAAGDDSPEVRNSNVRLFPQNQCGFGF